MNSKTIKKIFMIGGAGLSWLVGLARKPRGKKKAHRTIPKNRKEHSGMFGSILKIGALLLKILIGGGVVIAAVYALFKKVKSFTDRPGPVMEILEDLSPKAETPPAPKVSYQALFAKKCELEQRMASVTGGETGLFMLREMMRVAVSEGRPDIQYRGLYQMKQDKLRGYMKDYRALLKQAEGAPKEEKRRFEPKEGLSLYQELLDETI